MTISEGQYRAKENGKYDFSQSEMRLRLKQKRKNLNEPLVTTTEYNQLLSKITTTAAAIGKVQFEEAEHQKKADESMARLGHMSIK